MIRSGRSVPTLPERPKIPRFPTNPRATRPTRADLVALAGLVIAVTIFFAPALFGDRAVFTWNMDLWSPWTASADAEDLARPTRLADCARQFAVMRHIATDAFSESRAPLWNPWIFAGTPFLANFQPGVFYPPNVLLSLSGMSVPDQMSWYLWFHLLVAVTGLYALLRRFALSAGAAAVGAVVFGWSGYMAARTGVPTMVASAAWLPWALRASRGWFDRRGGASWAGMAASLGMSGLAGFAQIFVFTAYTWAAYGIVEGALRRPHPRAKTWIGWALAGAVGLLLVSVHLLPAAEFMGRAQDANQDTEMLASGTLHPVAAGKFLVPGLLGNPVEGSNATHALTVRNGYYHQTERSTAVYAGLLPLLLACMVLLSPGDHRREAFFGALLAAGGLLWCFDTPLLAIGKHLPGLGFSRPDRAAFLWCAGVSVLAGLGAQRLAGPEGTGTTRLSHQLATGIALVGMLFAAAVTVSPGVMVPQRVLEIAGEATIGRAGVWSLCAAAAALALVTLRTSARIGGGAFLILALLLTGADLGRVAWKMNVMQPESAIFRDATPGGSLEFLAKRREAEGPFRVIRYETVRGQFRGVLPPSTGAPYGIEDALGFDSINTRRYRSAMHALDPATVVKRGNFRGVRNAAALSSPLLDAMNVRFVLAAPGTRLPGFATVHDTDMAILENAGAVPRVRLVGGVRVFPNEDAVLRAMSHPSFDPSASAASESPIPGLTDAPGGEAGAARVESYAAEAVRVSVNARRPALLVLADSHDPGWKASIDGKVVPIHRVDHLFRGVRVDPGDREVIFRYDPPEYRKGAILSLGALLALIAGTLAWGRGTGRASSPSERSAPS